MGWLDIFKRVPKKEYRDEILPEIRGESRGVEVCFRNFPCRVAVAEPHERIEYHDTFNSELTYEFFEEIGDYETFADKALVAPVIFDMDVKGAPPFVCEIQMKPQKSEGHFHDNATEAVINAFQDGAVGR